MKQRTRFEDFIRAELTEFRNRLVAFHMQEVAELVEENADLHQDLSSQGFKSMDSRPNYWSSEGAPNQVRQKKSVGSVESTRMRMLQQQRRSSGGEESEADDAAGSRAVSSMSQVVPVPSGYLPQPKQFLRKQLSQQTVGSNWRRSSDDDSEEESTNIHSVPTLPNATSRGCLKEKKQGNVASRLMARVAPSHSPPPLQPLAPNPSSSSQPAGLGEDVDPSDSHDTPLGTDTSPRRVSQNSMESMNTEGDTDFEVLHEWKGMRNWASCMRRSVDGRSTSAIEIQDVEGFVKTNRSATHWLEKNMMMPSSGSFNAAWIVMGLACVAWDMVLIPLDLLNLEEGPVVTGIFWLVRLYWTLDMPKNFFTGRLQKDGLMETRPHAVAKQYAKSWLPLDIVCLLTDWMIPFMNFGTRASALQGVRLLRLARLLRLVKVTRLEAIVSQWTHSETVVLCLGLVKLIVVLLALAHLIACSWYRIGMGSFADEVPTPAGWVFQHGLENAPLQDRYAWSLHWSLAQFTGEMIFEPRNSVERSFAIFVLVVAFLVSSLFVSGITTSMTRLFFVTQSQASQLQALRRYLFTLRISSSLTARLQRNAQHVLAQQKKTAPALMNLISEPLRAEFYYELHSPVIMPHPFFKGYDQVCPASIRRVCQKAVHPVLLSRGDIVFSDFEAPACPRMFFFSTGEGGLKYRQVNQLLQYVDRGSWFCEMVLWTTWIHCGSLTASQECELLAVDSVAFRGVATLFPSRQAGKYAVAFVDQLNKEDKGKLSDLWQPDYDDLLESMMKGNTTSGSASTLFMRQDTMASVVGGGGNSINLSARLKNLFRSATVTAVRRIPQAQKSAWSETTGRTMELDS